MKIRHLTVGLLLGMAFAFCQSAKAVNPVTLVLMNGALTVGNSSPPFPSDIIEWWDTRTADFTSTTGAGQRLNTWTGRQNGITATGSGLTRPIVVSDGTNNYVYFTVDFTVAGAFTSGSFTDGDLVLQTGTYATGIVNGTQSSGSSLDLTSNGSGYIANGTGTWVDQSTGAIFTPSAFPSYQSATNYMPIGSGLTYSQINRSMFFAVANNITATGSQVVFQSSTDADDEFFSSGVIHSHWNGTHEIDTVQYSANNIGILYSVANSTQYVQGLSSESAVKTGDVESPGTVLGGNFSAASNVAGNVLMRGALFYDRTLTVPETATVLAWFASYYGATAGTNSYLLIASGDSITSGVGSTINPVQGWPQQLCRLCTYQPKLYNRGLPGASIWPGAGIYVGTALQSTDLSRNSFLGTRILTLMAGTNDISVNNRTAAQIEGDTASWISTMRSADPGAIIVGLTILPKGSFSGGQITTKNAINAWILGTANYDYTVNLDSDIRLSDPTNLTYYSYDQIHPNTNGYAAIAQDVKAVLAAHGLVP